MAAIEGSPFGKQRRTKRSYSISHYTREGAATPVSDSSVASLPEPPQLLQLVVGFKEIQGSRKTMEDAHVKVVPVARHEPSGVDAFFGVFDGHGGDRAASWVAQHLLDKIETAPAFNERLESGARNLERAIFEGIMASEKEFLETALNVDSAMQEMHDGTTVCIALFSQRELFVANVGDSEAVLCRGGKAVKLTETHNPRGNPAEGERVVSAGGRLYNRRVGHPQFNPAVMSIAVSRSIGDAGFKHPKYTKGKPSGLIPDPYVVRVPLTEDDKFLILACDGLWDVMSPDEAVAFVQERILTTPVREIAEEMTAWAFANGSLDNISVFVIALEWPSEKPLRLNDSSSRIEIVGPITPAAAGHVSSSGRDDDGPDTDFDVSEDGLNAEDIKLRIRVSMLERELLAKDESITQLQAEVAELKRQLDAKAAAPSQ